MPTITVTVAMPNLQRFLLCLSYSDCCYAYLTATCTFGPNLTSPCSGFPYSETQKKINKTLKEQLVTKLSEQCTCLNIRDTPLRLRIKVFCLLWEVYTPDIKQDVMGYLKSCEGVAEKTLDPSGDHLKSETPPPPSRRSGMHVSMGTSHAYK